MPTSNWPSTSMHTSTGVYSPFAEEQRSALVWEYLMPQDFTLGDAVRQIALVMADNKLKLPCKDDAPWHVLFYRLSLVPELREQFRFLQRMRFDSDRRYPRSKELSEFLQGMHTAMAAGVTNPSYDEIRLLPELADRWREASKALPQGTDKLLQKALELAREQFPTTA
jgi:hypothetical protein